ncbi:MAG: thrombospondin type 3 repeat-containing protein [Anaerolineales bacterium]|nr:thrombospondin type 3 repeat-containing protein [Anaerolineales bacterium]
MFKQKRLTVLSMAVVLALLVAAVMPFAALADDVAPPPTEAPVVDVAPTEEPVVDAAPTEEPVVDLAPTEAPVVDVAPTEVPVMDVAPTEEPVVDLAPTEEPVVEVAPTDVPVVDAAPTEEPVVEVAPPTESVSDVVAALAEANAVLVDADGNPIPMASQEAAEALTALDPYIVRAGVTHRFLTDCTGQPVDANNTCTVSTTPIQAAIDFAFAGETVNVEAGTYNENVIIAKQLVLTGLGAGATTTSFTLNNGASVTGSSNIFAPLVNVNAGAKIQDGILLASPGGTVNVAAGTYVWAGAITIDKSLTIQGAGREDTIVQRAGTPGTYDNVFDITAASDVTISDMTVGYETLLPVTPTTPLGGYVIAHGGGYSPTNKLTIDNVAFDGGRSAILSSGTGLVVQNSLFTGEWLRGAIRPTETGFLITNNNFQEVHYQFGPVTLEGGAVEGEISYNTMANGAIPGYFKTAGYVFTIEVYTNATGSANLIIKNNDFDAVYPPSPGLNQSGNPMRPMGIYFEGAGYDGSKVFVQDNTFTGYSNYYAVYLPGTTTVTGNTFTNNRNQVSLYAAVGGIPDTAISDVLTSNTFDRAVTVKYPDNSLRPTIYGTIQGAINAASEGDTINVAAGTYNETVTFDNTTPGNLTISGDPADRPVIDGGIKFANTIPINGITLENLYFQGTARPTNERIFWNANTAAINNFSMDNSVLDGEGVDDRHGISGNLFGGSFSITNTEFKNIYGFAVMDIDSSSDYSPWGGNGLPLTTVTFANNNIHDVDGSIALRGHTPNRTTLVNVYGNNWNGIGGNVPGTDDQWAAIEINHAEQANVYDNTITHVAQGIWGDGQAIQLWDVGTLDVHDNVFTDNYQGIFVYGGSAGGDYGGPWAVPGGSIYNNEFQGNTQYGISIDSNATGGPLDAENNWWGCAAGPGQPGCDTVSAQVDYTPWLTVPVGQTDTDGDGIQDATDNCATAANADQTNSDGDGLGNACDLTPNGDTDGDGVDNAVDNCPTAANANQADTDGDGLGNACDTTPNGDTDGDGVDNAVDNCPTVANADQVDFDSDGLGNACDLTPNGDPTPHDGTTTISGTTLSPLLIPVTGGEQVALNTTASTTLQLPGGNQVSIDSGVGTTASVTAEDETSLPATVPSGNTFVSAMKVDVMNGGTAVTTLPAGTTMEVSFVIPSSFAAGQTFSILYWNPALNGGLGDWEVVPATVTSDGHVVATVNFTGTFVLVTP